jgi:hypothetical protein
MVVVIDECVDLGLEVAGQIIVLKQDAVLERLMPALDLVLADDSRFFYSHDDGVRHRGDRRYALRLPGKTSFTEELVRSKHCEDCFPALKRR